jgi:hypothetical protein
VLGAEPWYPCPCGTLARVHRRSGVVIGPDDSGVLVFVVGASVHHWRSEAGGGWLVSREAGVVVRAGSVEWMAAVARLVQRKWESDGVLLRLNGDG